MPINLHNPFKRAPAPGRSVRFVGVVVSPVSALLRARHRTGGRTWCRGGCQLHLALGAGLCTRVEQTLPTASQADEQELSDRRDLYTRLKARTSICIDRWIPQVRRSTFCS